jgi:hypothetical protein
LARLASIVAAIGAAPAIERWRTLAAQWPCIAECSRFFLAWSPDADGKSATNALVVDAATSVECLRLLAVPSGALAGMGVELTMEQTRPFGTVEPPGPSGADGPNATASSPLVRATEDRRRPTWSFWAVLAAGILAVKFVGLVLDPQPQFFMGDSASYLHTALTGWVPPDRSYAYGVLVRLIVADTQSLAPVVLAQTLASASTAWLAAWWAHLVFRCGRAVSCLVALACALDPAQLLYERYLMTEAFALLALAAMLVSLSTLIVRGNRGWLVPATLAAVAAVALRTSLLPVAVACLVGAPMLAFAARTLNARRALATGAVALLCTPLLLLPAMQVRSGPFLLAAWSPLLKASDFPDPSLGERVLQGIDLSNPELFAREANLWHPSGFMRRLGGEVADETKRDRMARATALQVLKRDPLGVFALGLRTYAHYWNRETRLRMMRWDVGQNPLGADFRATLAARFRLVVDELPRPTLVSRYYLGVSLWTSLVGLLAPLLLVLVAPVLVALGRPRPPAAALGLLVLASGTLLAVTSLLGTLPVVRYLQPLGWMVSAGLLAPLLQLAIDRPVRRVAGVAAPGQKAADIVGRTGPARD